MSDKNSNGCTYCDDYDIMVIAQKKVAVCAYSVETIEQVTPKVKGATPENCPLKEKD